MRLSIPEVYRVSVPRYIVSKIEIKKEIIQKQNTNCQLIFSILWKLICAPMAADVCPCEHMCACTMHVNILIMYPGVRQGRNEWDNSERSWKSISFDKATKSLIPEK